MKRGNNVFFMCEDDGNDRVPSADCQSKTEKPYSSIPEEYIS